MGTLKEEIEAIVKNSIPTNLVIGTGTNELVTNSIMSTAITAAVPTANETLKNRIATALFLNGYFGGL